MSATTPANMRTVNPYLLVEQAAEVIQFIETVLGGTTRMRMDRPDGSLGHAEIEVGDALLMLGSPTEPFGPQPASLFVYVEDSDAAHAAAVAFGCSSEMAPMTMPHAGVRYGAARDAGGNLWWIAQHLEDVTPEEEQRRVDEHGLPEVPREGDT